MPFIAERILDTVFQDVRVKFTSPLGPRMVAGALGKGWTLNEWRSSFGSVNVEGRAMQGWQPSEKDWSV